MNLSSRRAFLGGVGSTALACSTGAKLPPALPRGSGEPVLVAGAGVAGLTTARELRRRGGNVVVIEAADRVGGRTISLRRGDVLQEEGGPAQHCRFREGFYLNAGAGRLPHYHDAVLGLCRDLGVPLEPFIFSCRENLLHSPDLHGGTPIAFRQFEHSLRGAIADRLARMIQAGVDVPDLKNDQEMLEMLQQFGQLCSSGAAESELRCSAPDAPPGWSYQGGDRLGFVRPPGAGKDAGQQREPIALEELIQSDLWKAKNGGLSDNRVYWQSSHMQPVGGMDRIAEYLAASLGGSETIFLGWRVVSVKSLPRGVEVVTKNAAGETRILSGSHFVSTISPPLYGEVGSDNGIENDFSHAHRQALAGYSILAACKVGWQSKARFWEDQGIYGGISWTTERASQIWYPSSEFHSSGGTLTGAYNRGAEAETFGAQSVGDRILEAHRLGQKLHGDAFTENVDPALGLAIAWQNMPYQAGGWADEPENQKGRYEVLLAPSGRTYFAGDYLSHTPGWIEGAVRSAVRVVDQMLQPPRYEVQSVASKG